MNPLLAAAIAELEKKGFDLALAALTLLAKDLAAGKSIAEALDDLAKKTAEEQALLFNQVLDELDKLGVG